VQNGETWYCHANIQRGRLAENGSLYLITGFDKTRYWGTASFSNVPHGFEMAFSPRARDGNNVNNSYWLETGFAATRYGPTTIEHFGVAQEPSPNQCTFIRGFKLSLSGWLWASIVGHTVGASTIKDMKSSDILSRNKFVPFGGGGSWLERYFSKIVGRGAGKRRASNLESTPALALGDKGVVVESDFRTASDVRKSL
jgi:hypothetical protein